MRISKGATMPAQPETIPFCRSEFLQDFTIDFGRHIRQHGHGWTWSMGVDLVEHDEQSMERLTLWIWTSWSTLINLTLWEDKAIWVRVFLLPGVNQTEYTEGFYPPSDLLTCHEIIEALVDTVSVSTRLAYQESTIPLLRQFWKHHGKIEITGKLMAK
jgi:hypothetical protein